MRIHVMRPFVIEILEDEEHNSFNVSSEEHPSTKLIATEHDGKGGHNYQKVRDAINYFDRMPIRMTVIRDGNGPYEPQDD